MDAMAPINIAIVVVDCVFALLVSLVMVAQKIYAIQLGVDLMVVALLVSLEEIYQLWEVPIVFVMHLGWVLSVRRILARDKRAVVTDTACHSVRRPPIVNVWEDSLVPHATQLAMDSALATEESTPTIAATLNPPLVFATTEEDACTTINILDSLDGVALLTAARVMACNAKHQTTNANNQAHVSMVLVFPFLAINPTVQYASVNHGVLVKMACAWEVNRHRPLHYEGQTLDIALKYPF